MTFLNQRLPSKVELGAVRRDAEDIEIVTTDGGWETRNARHSQSLLEFEISFPTAKVGDETRAAVIALYKAARGKLRTFRFRDYSDYQLTDELIGLGDGVTTAFQIKKSWTVDGVTESRRITRPVSPFVVKLGGVVQSAGYAIDYSTGILTFTGAPSVAEAVRVTGQFDLPVRFDTPLTSTMVTGSLEHIDTLTLREVRE